MTDENWATTPQEKVLDTIYEALASSGHTESDLYGVTETRPEAQLWVHIDGKCWHIVATPHKHLDDS